MSKQNKSKTPDKKTGSSGNSKYILIAVLIIIIGYFFYDNVIREEQVKPPVFVDPKEKVKNTTEPQFKKEGELEFISLVGKKDSAVKKIDIELALDDAEREQGLMYRKSMDDNKGMLSIFDTDELQSFWMKNTIMSLDIMFVNSDFKIVKIHKSTTPFSENSLPSDEPSKYVVEVAAGFSERYGIKEGDKILFKKD